MQLTVVLQLIYCDRLSEQLAAQEEAKKAKKKGQLVGDGLSRLLTSDEFYKRVVSHKKAMAEEKAAHENRCKQKEQQSLLLAAWKEADEARKQWNREQKAAYHQQLTLWTDKREHARQEKRQVCWVKLKLGKLEVPLRKPGSGSVEGDEEVEGPRDEGDNGNDDGTDVGMESGGENEDE
ncbi:hypothetical protein HD554DRAFT_2021159 [Boletus coccyginus]|nr:hypothetical protein HD554DRAFT_2021159 [Boletus coccyginus]